VSNSSSQAHIVLFPRVPESPEDLRNILGKNRISELESIPLHKNILDQHPTNIASIISELSQSAYVNNWRIDRFKADQTKLDRAKNQAEFHSKCMEHVSRSFAELTKIKGDGVYYIFEYDDDGEMKWHNGDVFKKLKFFSISHH